MFTRRWQRFCACWIVAFWLPLSIVSQAHATVMLAQSIGGGDHPALETAHEAESLLNLGKTNNYIVVDAALFWDAVDHYEGECQLSAFCNAPASAVPMAPLHWHALRLNHAAPECAFSPPHSIHLQPDTPPPRTHS